MLLSDAICRDRGFAALSPKAAVLFFLLLARVNGHGKMDGDVYTIKGSCCRYVDYLSIEELPGLLQEISRHTSVKWFEDAEGNHWVHALKFAAYNQGLRRDRMGKDKLPSYNSTIKHSEIAFTPGVLREYSGSTPGVVREWSGSTAPTPESGAADQRVGEKLAITEPHNNTIKHSEKAITPGVVREYSGSTPPTPESGVADQRVGGKRAGVEQHNNNTEKQCEIAFTPGVLREYSGSEGKGEGKGEGEEKKNSAEPSSGGSALAPVEPILLADGSEYRPTLAQYDRLRHLYPGVDVTASIRSMSAWSLANPRRRKTARGILRFVTAWLDREQNRPRRPVSVMPPDPYAHAARGREALLEE
jgi:hypothetical protein